MAQINKHEFYGLDTAYVEKHKELFDFFESQNLDVEINDDLSAVWPNITQKKEALPEAAKFSSVKNKMDLLKKD